MKRTERARAEVGCDAVARRCLAVERFGPREKLTYLGVWFDRSGISLLAASHGANCVSLSKLYFAGKHPGQVFDRRTRGPCAHCGCVGKSRALRSPRLEVALQSAPSVDFFPHSMNVHELSLCQCALMQNSSPC